MHQVHIYGSDFEEHDDEDFEGMEAEIDDGNILPFHLMNFNGSSSSLLSLLKAIVFWSYLFNSTVAQIVVHPFDVRSWKVRQLFKQLE